MTTDDLDRILQAIDHLAVKRIAITVLSWCLFLSLGVIVLFLLWGFAVGVMAAFS